MSFSIKQFVIITLYTIFVVISFSDYSFANPMIKVAILETFQKLSTEKFHSDYLSGITEAVREAESVGYKIEVKTFFFGKGDLDIFNELPNIEAWKPDLIIGPRSSNKLLLLKDKITDTMVLSPYATASAVSYLPSNFYSLTLPNEFVSQALVNFIIKEFPKKNILAIVEADCKNCMDFVDVIKKQIAKDNKNTNIKRVKFTQDQVETLNIEDLLKNYDSNDLILLPDTSYSSAVLVSRIPDYLKKNDIVFLGTDEWGSWQGSYVGRLKSKYTYTGYRVAPWHESVDTKEIEEFKYKYYQNNHKQMNDIITFASYHTLMSAVEALSNYSKQCEMSSMKVKLLCSYKAAIKNNKNWFRSDEFSILKRNNYEEMFLMKMSPLHRSLKNG